MNNFDWDKALLALVIWREAEGESVEGKLAVGNVVRNRVMASKNHDDWSAVLTAKWQFSSLTAPGDGMLVQWPNHAQQAWQDAMEAAERVYTLGNCDNTQGATMYANLSVCNPAWSHTMTKTVVIGKHSFFK